MSHKQRLDAIEQRFPPEGWRCDVCVDWPAHRIDWPNDHEYAADPTPAACPSCGYEPTTIRVRYADDWKAL
jgi:rubrerythrin